MCWFEPSRSFPEGANQYEYSFAESDVSCQAFGSSNPNAGKSGNRTKLTVNGVDTTYCYDQADRLISSSDETLTDAGYDSHGNTISIGDSSHKTEFDYDSSDRNIKVKAGTKESLYTRDALDRIVKREVKDNGSTQSDVRYGYTGEGDASDFLLDATGNVVQKYVTLPGDVLVKIKPQSTSAAATTYSLPNLHGDVMATVNADGALTGKYITGPYGETLPVSPSGFGGTPTNTADGTSFNYVGQHQKITDAESTYIQGGIIQMGARVYIPTLGRFLSVDPIEGGTDNNYVYTNDPVNENDLDGKRKSKRDIRKELEQAGKKLDKYWSPYGVSGGLRSTALKSAPKIWSATKSYSGNIARWITKNDPVFGYKKGILNKGPNRIGYSRCKSNTCFRWGKAGKHEHRFNLQLPIKWKGQK